MTHSKFTIQHLSPLIGSYIRGLDLSQAIEEETLKELRAIWLQRKVLFFPDQQLTPQQQLDFTAQFGDLDKYPFLDGMKDYPFIAEVLKLPEEKINFGGVWHTDTTYLEEPALGASLYAIELPPLGGDTMFANMASAYQALPDDIKQQIDGLNAVNTSSKSAVAKTRAIRFSGDVSTMQVITHTHPVVRIHPETGEKILYVNEAHTLHFEGQTEQQSQNLLNYLYKHAQKPEFQCRYQWTLGAVVLWDNRATHHYPINDYTGFRRLLHRVSLKGDKPR